VARRSGDHWFVGAITDESERFLAVELDFLERGKRYTAKIFRDGDNAHWEFNPRPVAIDTREVGGGDSLPIRLAPGGGAAIWIRPLSEGDNE
jgi:alpha-glucosidase